MLRERRTSVKPAFREVVWLCFPGWAAVRDRVVSSCLSAPGLTVRKSNAQYGVQPNEALVQTGWCSIVFLYDEVHSPGPVVESFGPIFLLLQARH